MADAHISEDRPHYDHPGQPALYRPAYAELAYKHCLLGAKNPDLARLFNVSVRTIDHWLNSEPEFLRSVLEGKERADAEIAHSMYQRAKGYSHEAVKIFMPAGATEPVYAPYTEHYPPDVGAAMNWLSNRQPHLWRNTKAVDVNLKQEHSISPETYDLLHSVLDVLTNAEESTLIDATPNATDAGNTDK